MASTQRFTVDKVVHDRYSDGPPVRVELSPVGVPDPTSNAGRGGCSTYRLELPLVVGALVEVAVVESGPVPG